MLSSISSVRIPATTRRPLRPFFPLFLALILIGTTAAVLQRPLTTVTPTVTTQPPITVQYQPLEPHLQPELRSSTVLTPEFQEDQQLGASWSNDVAFGDLDRDGDLDAFVVNGDSLFGEGQANRVWINDGNGFFDDSDQYIGRSFSFAVALGDVDGDADLDAFVINNPADDSENTAGSNVIWLNDGFGFFTDVITLTEPGGANAPFESDIALGDLDGDGDLDAFITADGSADTLWINDGNGNFTKSNTTYANNANSTSVAFGDINGDKFLDILVTNPNPTQPGNYLLLNDGDGTFTDGSPQMDPFKSEAVALGDINGDGALDAFLANGVTSNGEGNAVLYNVNGQLRQPLLPQSIGNSSSRHVALGDLDGDGDLDAYVANQKLFQGGEPDKIWLNNNGEFVDSEMELGMGNSTAVALGDIDRDGDLDAFVTHAEGDRSNRVFRNDSARFTFNGQTLPTIERSQDVAVGDVNNDGLVDIVVANHPTLGGPAGLNHVWLNDGQNFTLAASFDPGNTNAIALGDFNGDNNLDIVSGNTLTSGQATIWFGNGTGTFLTDGNIYNPHIVKDIAIGDLDGDGDLDIFFANAGDNTNESAPNTVYLNQGDGTFVDSGQTVGYDNSTAVSLGDLDADGDLDAFVVNFGFPEAWLNDGNGNFEGTFQPFDPMPSSGVDLGDLDGDGDLDAFIANDFALPDYVFFNDGTGLFTDSGQTVGDEESTDIELGDVDNDGDLDAFVTTRFQEEKNVVWINNGRGEFTTDFEIGSDGSAVGLGDFDFDGDLDAFVAFGALSPIGQSNKLYLNERQGHYQLLPSGHTAGIIVQRPLNVPATSEYIPTEIVEATQIPISFTIFHPYSQSIPSVRAYYSFNGGGQWYEAIPANPDDLTNLESYRWPFVDETNTHIFLWDTFESGFFGQADNVVIRIEADLHPAATDSSNPHQIAGSYTEPAVATTSYPFRVRGTQIRVLNDNTPMPDAFILRIPSGQTSGGSPITNSAGDRLTTDTDGYLQGIAQVGIGDLLYAGAAISGSHYYTYYHTSLVDENELLGGYSLDTPGVQEIFVSADQPLLLFDLDISIEWDARNDDAFLSDLQNALGRTSEILFDVSNGQMALGNINIYQAKENWSTADITIKASNGLRPMAVIGGVVTTPTNDIGLTGAIENAFVPGQIRMGPNWDPFGQTTTDLSEDWWRAMAHELGHYLLFLPDNYLGVVNGAVTLIDCQGSFMTNTYDDEYSEFLTEAGWTGDCLSSVAEQTTGRNDWETILTYYPMLNADANNPGPTSLPFDMLTINIYEPERAQDTITARNFDIRNGDTGSLLTLPTSHGYLRKTMGTTDVITDDIIIDLGTADGAGDRLKVRGAEEGDILCLLETDNSWVGCSAVTESSTSIRVYNLTDWKPNLEITPVSSRTLNITVTQQVASGKLNLQVVPAYNSPLSPTLNIAPWVEMTAAGNNTYTTTITLDYPVSEGYVRVWEPGADPAHEMIHDFSVNIGSWGGFIRSWGGFIRSWGGFIRSWGGFIRSWGGNARSSDGAVSVFNAADPFGETGIETIQSLATIPNLPSWLTAVGSAYRVDLASGGDQYPNRNIIFDYKQRELPDGYEFAAHIYYSPDSGQTWQRLTTTKDMVRNRATAEVNDQAAGIYVLAATVDVGPFSTGWNTFGYPIPETRAVSDTMQSIDGSYASLFNFDGTNWTQYDVAVLTEQPELAPLVNTLGNFEFASAYWISATTPVTLHLAVPAEAASADARAINNGEAPPATFYGWVAPTADFQPTAGMAVTASVNGNVCGETTVIDWEGRLAYKIHVTAETAIGTPNGCGMTGEEVVFSVGSWQMDHNRPWQNGQAEYLSFSQVAETSFTLFLPIIHR